MATIQEVADNVFNQMLKGITGQFPKEYSGEAGEKARWLLMDKYREKIVPVVSYIPRFNAAIGAVVVKCMLKYGPDRAIQFAKSVRDGTFNGQSDPAHLMWLYLARNKGFKSLDVYKVAVTAARAYCESRQLTGLRPAGTDIFEWNKLWEDKLNQLDTARWVSPEKVEIE